MTPHAIKLPDDIVTRLQGRDESAYETLVLSAAPALIRFAAQRLGSTENAQDVVQDVFYNIWQQGDRFQPKGTVTAYLFAAVRNRVLDVIRHESVVYRSQTLVTLHTQPHIDGDSHTSPDAILQWEEDVQRLRHALAQLTEHQRTAVTLRYEQGMTIAEVADVLEISAKGAERLMTRIRHLLRDYFLD